MLYETFAGSCFIHLVLGPLNTSVVETFVLDIFMLQNMVELLLLLFVMFCAKNDIEKFSCCLAAVEDLFPFDIIDILLLFLIDISIVKIRIVKSVKFFDRARRFRDIRFILVVLRLNFENFSRKSKSIPTCLLLYTILDLFVVEVLDTYITLESFVCSIFFVCDDSWIKRYRRKMKKRR